MGGAVNKSLSVEHAFQPSPLPSPIRWEREKLLQRWIKLRAFGRLKCDQSFTLSPGERDGVRGSGKSNYAFVDNCRIVFALLISCFFVGIAAHTLAADNSSGFDAANKLYEQGKFSEAATAYQQLVQSGTTSSALYYNMGNAFFKSGQIGHAVAAYRDAEQIAPRDPEVRANLQFVRGKVQGPSLAPTGAERWLANLTINEWAAFAAILLWLWLGLLILIQVRPNLKRPLQTVLWIGGVALLTVCGCLTAAWSNASAKTAIVVASDAVVHNGPLEEAPGAITVHDGAELTVLDTKNDWLQVRLDSTRTGWLKRDQVVLASGV